MMILALSVSSCKDDDTLDGGGGSGGTGGSGGGTGGGGGQVDEDYLPRETGNTWNYSDNSTVEITGSEDVGSDKYWTITNFGPIAGVSLDFAEDITVSSIKVAKDGEEYKIIAELDVILNGTADPIQYTILKDDSPVGTTWSGALEYNYSYANPIPGLPPLEFSLPSVPYNFEIMQKGISHTVGTTTYENVIHINQQFDFVGGLVSTDIYYAEGVGVISYTNAATTIELESYDLN